MLGNTKKYSKKAPYFNSSLLTMLVFTLVLPACSKVDGSLIEGHWRASEVSEEGLPLETDLSELSFTFQGNFYSYFNTNLLEEAGIFEISGDRLITKDTSRSSDMKKMVQILLLTNDSLHLRMNAGGREQILKLFRAGESESEDILILD
jgi:hypothetical protein